MSISASDVKRHAVELGFDLCGIAPAQAFSELRFFKEWLDRGYAGEMSYLERTAQAREDVRVSMPWARSVIALATLYNSRRPHSTDLPPDEARISRYAWGDDYHVVVGARLEKLLRWMRERGDTSFEARSYVDTGPVQERVYARYAGLGWIGKNTCLINKDLGSWLFLSEIVTSLPLEPDVPALDHCGTCTRCLDLCPTGALVEPHVLDSNRCLSYLTIELKGAIPTEHHDSLGSHVYGCDICQEVCPWNSTAASTTDPSWSPRPGLDQPRLVSLWRRSDAELSELLKGSAMKRAKLRGLRRNVAVALGNLGTPEAREALQEVGDPQASPSAADPMVAEHVASALRKVESGEGGDGA
jgi:epoxyqueuosine reductase